MKKEQPQPPIRTATVNTPRGNYQIKTRMSKDGILQQVSCMYPTVHENDVNISFNQQNQTTA